jgi:hypothetical protein
VRFVKQYFEMSYHYFFKVYLLQTSCGQLPLTEIFLGFMIFLSFFLFLAKRFSDPAEQLKR